MEYLSVAEYAQRMGVSERTVRNYCANGKLEGAFLVGKTWNIPSDATLPEKGKQRRESALLRTLRREMESRVKGGIYHRTQIDLTYNSNHIEGGRLTHDQTRYIFETNTIGITDEAVHVDDIVETVNHFRCVDLIIAHAQDRLSLQWFAVGDYKRLPNEVGGMETTLPEQVAGEMRALLTEYNRKQKIELDDILDFHQRFERIHPFQDGNGRVGRLIMFKECLAHDIVPFIITDDLKMFYYRGLSNWPAIPGYLRDTCLTAQDFYKSLMEYFRIE